MSFRDPFPPFSEDPTQCSPFIDQEQWHSLFDPQNPNSYRPSRDHSRDDWDEPSFNISNFNFTEGIYVVQLAMPKTAHHTKPARGDQRQPPLAPVSGPSSLGFTDDSVKVKIKSSDGKIFETTRACASMSSVIESILKEKMPPVPIPFDNITSSVLQLVLSYCQYHTRIRTEISSVPASELPMWHTRVSEWDARFVDLDPKVLCEVASAAYHLDIKPLVNLTCRAIAMLISGKSTEEIRQTFDISEEYNSRSSPSSATTSPRSSVTSLFSTPPPPASTSLSPSSAGSNVSQAPLSVPPASSIRVPSPHDGSRFASAEKPKHRDATSSHIAPVDDRPLEDLLEFINDGDPSKKKKNKKKPAKKPTPTSSPSPVAQAVTIGQPKNKKQQQAKPPQPQPQPQHQPKVEPKSPKNAKQKGQPIDVAKPKDADESAKDDDASSSTAQAQVKANKKKQTKESPAGKKKVEGFDDPDNEADKVVEDFAKRLEAMASQQSTAQGRRIQLQPSIWSAIMTDLKKT